MRLTTATALHLLVALALFPAGCNKSPTPPQPIRLANTGFEQPLDSGWTQAVANDSATRGYIERSDTLGQPDSGSAVRVYKFHKQFCSVQQVVPVETLGQVARFWARFRLGGSVPCSPVAAVAFDFLDSASRRLGRTLFYLPSQYNTWTDSDTLHLIRVADTTGRWARCSLNLEAELDSNLARVDKSLIRQLRVELFASVDYSG